MSETFPALLTRPEAAKTLRQSLRTVDEFIASGDLPVIKIGRSVRIRESSLALFIEAREMRMNPKARKKAKARKFAAK